MTQSTGKNQFKNSIVFLSRILRNNGVNTTVRETLDAVDAIRHINTNDAEHFLLALRTSLIKDPRDFLIFDKLFRAMWNERSVDEDKTVLENSHGRNAISEKLKTSQEGEVVYSIVTDEGIDDNNMDEKIMSNGRIIYSPLDIKTRRTIDNFRLTHERNIKLAVKRFKRNVATLPGRRLQLSHSGDIDLKRTIRRSLNHGVLFSKLIRSKKKTQRTKLLILLDISGSMDEYTERLFHVIFTMKKMIPSLEVLAFSVGLVRLTDYFSINDPDMISNRISDNITNWGSGTKIGYSLKLMLDRYYNIIDSKTVVVIISDGWDVGDMNILKSSLIELKRKIHTLVWLNPLIDKPGFQPITMGMSEALPYIDHFGSPRIFEEVREQRKYFKNI